jgi:preprotein translocase subunit SecF
MSDVDTPTTTAVAGEPRHRLWHRLYHGETAFDFVGRWRRWALLSGTVILIGLISLVFTGLNLGIDFKGGTSWEVKAPGVSVNEARDALRGEGLADAKIQIVGSDLLRVQQDIGEGTTARAKQERVKETLSKLAGGSEVSVNAVGASWGHDITRKAERALVFFFVAIALYISIRFEWKMAVAALAAVVHDILVTVGVYSLVGFEVTPATVVAFLTILGYSIYDTIVVFDKVEENTKGLASTGRATYSDVVNLSMNQVLMRSLNTSFVAILPIASVLFIGAYGMGATSLEDFGLALLVGLLTGAYSSIFIAAPLLAVLKEREPRYSAIRQRLAVRGATIGGSPLTPAAAAAGAGGIGGRGRGAGANVGDGGVLRPRAGGAGAGGSGATTVTAERPDDGAARPGGAPVPRPRKKSKKKKR